MTQNSIIEALGFDKTSGSLTYKGVRYLLMRPETIMSFQKGVEGDLGSKAGEHLYRGGFTGGRLSFSKYKTDLGLSDEQAIEFMLKMGAEIGWGRLSLIHYDPDAQALKIAAYGSPFAESYGKSSQGVCHFLRGVIAGMGSSLFNRNCRAIETECAAMGDDRCLFVIGVENPSADPSQI